LTLLLVYLFARMETPVYLLDFHVWEPPASWKVSSQKPRELLEGETGAEHWTVGVRF
jgi:hypothetical protein